MNVELNILAYLSIMILGGMACGRLVKLIKLPNVTGYLIAGLLLGPSILNIIPDNVSLGTPIVSEIALGFIAFSIGGEFKLSYFKRVGKSSVVIAVLAAFLATAFVVVGLLIVGCDLPFALLLGAIAAATAPAATIMVINQYKAKGPVTQTLLSVVAIDDAIALMLFGVAAAIANSITSPGTGSVFTLLLMPLIEIFGAIIFGFLLGMILTYCLRWFKKDGNRLSLTVAFVFLGAGIATLFNFSALLMCMSIGAALANFSKISVNIVRLVDKITPPIFILFFVESGAGLNLSILPSIGVVGITYVVTRMIGKYLGAYLGAVICKCNDNIKKYLGLALIPQAGVAIGLALAASTIVPDHAKEVRAVVLCATFIYEIIGPVLSKFALVKAKETTTK